MEVFLFDEPLSNLDAKLRADLRVELKRLHNNLRNTMIYVTHDQVEAMTLADRIAIMKGGKIMQLGTPAEIYGAPQNLYVADFIGSPSMTFMEGTIRNGAIAIPGHDLPLGNYAFKEAPADGRPAIIGIRPEHVLTGDNLRSAAYRAEVTVDLVEPMGSDTLVYCDFGGQIFRIRMDGQAQVQPGDRLEIGLNPATASLFDKTTEVRL